jgi:hypothetical protein
VMTMMRWRGGAVYQSAAVAGVGVGALLLVFVGVVELALTTSTTKTTALDLNMHKMGRVMHLKSSLLMSVICAASSALAG